MFPRLELTPEQRHELITAIMALVAVVLGIVLSLTGQVIGQALNPQPVEAPALSTADLMQALGTSHFANIETGSLKLDGHLLTGPVVAVSGTIDNGGTIAHGLGVAPTYVVCSAHGANEANVTVTAKSTTVLTLSTLTHAGAAVNEVLVTCLVVP